MYGRRLLPGLLVLVVGCVGTIEQASGSQEDQGNSTGDDKPNTVDTDGDGVPDAPAPGDGDGTPQGDGDGDGPIQGGDGDGDGDGDGTPAQFTYATVGTRCSGGARQRFVVISRAAGSCESHARALDDAATSDVLRVGIGDGGSYSGSVSLCDGSGCRDVNVSLTLGDGATSGDLKVGDQNIDQTVQIASCDYDVAVPPPPDALASNIAIGEVALYQGVKISLASNGQEVANRNAPVVEGRPGLVRVFVEPQGGFTSRPIIARLTLDNAGTKETLEQTLTVNAASSDQSLGSTLNFDLTGEQLRAGTEYSVSLHEAEVCGGAVSENSPARFPSSGLSQLGAEPTGSAFRVVIVPVRYNADGSGRTPNTSAEAVQGYRNYLYSIFPMAEIEISVRQPMDFNAGIFSNGDGWSELLDQCLAQRNADNPDDRTYYYCMFNPASSFNNYCQGGCVAGLGPVPRASDVGRRGAIGLGFGDAGGTFAHELGHALGRPHAPCGGVAGPDPNFPYSGGLIGSWGYDVITKDLFPPNFTDLMGYCGNTWISDYNYDLVFSRFQAVLTQQRSFAKPIALHSIVVGANGQLSLGHASSLTSLPEGEAVRVRYLDQGGGELLSADGSFMAVTHVSGGIVYVPAPPAGTVAVDIEGFGTLAL